MSASAKTKGLNPGWRVALCALAWLGGLGLQLQQAALWPVAVYGGLGALGGLLLLAAWRWPRCRWLPALMLACAALSVAAAGQRADARLAERLSPALEGQNLMVTGVVAAMTQVGLSGTRFQFEVEHAEALDAAVGANRPVQLPPVLALGWYNNFNDEAALDDPRAELRAGQRWRLPLRLKRPHGALNPDGFDVELLWFEQGLGATGYVRVARAGPQATLLAEAVAHPIERARQAVRDAIRRRVADPRAAGVLAALAVGDQAAIEREDWELFRTTGIAHLVSISGVHITMFAWMAGALASALWRRSTRLMLWLPAPTAARWAGLLLAVAYSMLAGWGVPAQRTVIMLGATVLMRSLGLRWPWLLVLLVAAVVVTALDPWALLQPGFWLSFAAVGLLLVSEPSSQAGEVDDRSLTKGVINTDQPAPSSAQTLARTLAEHGRASVAGHLRGQVIATLGLAPLSLVFFQQLSIVGFVANLVAIPLVTLLITPLALLGVLLPPLWAVAALAVQVLVWGLAWLAHWPFAVWLAPVAPAWAVACGLLGAVLGVLPVPWAVRWLALPLVLPLLWPPLPRPAPGSFELLAADIGQGTAVLVRTHGHLLVYDTGPQYSRDNDASGRVLLPLLHARGEPAIDLLILSHRDSDHVGGAATLLAGHPVRALQSSLEATHPLLAKAAQHHVSHSRCEAGQSWLWDGVRFEMLHPTSAEFDAPHKPNAVCCVLRVVDAAGRSALITGDIEAPQEAALLQRQGAALASTVLLVPHHGSRTSSSEDFLDTVQPQTAVVQAGYRSRYGHPAPDVLARYTERGIDVVRSDQCGAWLWHDGVANCTRNVRRRYWHWTAPGGGAIVANNTAPQTAP